MIASLRGYGRLAMGADGKVYAANCPPGYVFDPYHRTCVLLPRKPRSGGSGVESVNYESGNGVGVVGGGNYLPITSKSASNPCGSYAKCKPGFQNGQDGQCYYNVPPPSAPNCRMFGPTYRLTASGQCSPYVPCPGSTPVSALQGYAGVIMDNAGSAGSALRGFRGYGDANQDNWCNQNYPDPTNNAKCKQGWDLFKCPACVSPPWTAEGKLARGLTDVMGAAAQVISGSGSSSSSSPPPPAGGAGGGAAGAKGGGKAAAGATILGVPKTVAIVGGGLLALGVVAVAMKRMRRR